MTTRNWTILIMFFLPILFIYLGILVGKNLLEDLGLDEASDGIKIFFVGIFIVQAYCINSSVFINTPVLEKEFSLKYILNVMGCRPLPYWLGTFIFDYLAYLITVLIFYILVLENDVKFLNAYIDTLTLILAIFGADLIVYTYLCGYLFKKSNSAFKSFPIINFFVSYSIPWILTNLFEDNDILNNSI